MTLDEVRVEIDSVDSQMKPLFLQRMECARHVAEAKAVTGGDVYVPEREQIIIKKRSQGVEEFQEEYETFLLHLMSVSRRFQYGLLTGMQDQVLEGCLKHAELDPEKEYSQMKIAFQCSKSESCLNLCINMVKLNGILLDELELHTEDGMQKVCMVLDGNLNQKNMRQLLCQIAKETENFEIVELR